MSITTIKIQPSADLAGPNKIPTNNADNVPDNSNWPANLQREQLCLHNLIAIDVFGPFPPFPEDAMISCHFQNEAKRSSTDEEGAW